MPPNARMFEKLFSFCLDQIFPALCLCCRLEGQTLCGVCLGHIQSDPAWQDIEGMRVYSLYDYHDQPLFASVVRQWKYTGQRMLVKELMNGIELPVFKADYLVSIPLHKKRQLERGFNQAEDISLFLERSLNVERANGLKRLRETGQQARNTRQDRETNLKGAFTWTGADIEGKTVLLVDDVITTGSTMQNAAEALECQGANVIGFALFRSEKISD